MVSQNKKDNNILLVSNYFTSKLNILRCYYLIKKMKTITRGDINGKGVRK